MTSCKLCSNACGHSDSAAGRDAKCDPITGACTCPAGSGSSGIGDVSICTGYFLLVTGASGCMLKTARMRPVLNSDTYMTAPMCGSDRSTVVQSCCTCIDVQFSPQQSYVTIRVDMFMCCVPVQNARRSTACSSCATRAPLAPGIAHCPPTAAIAVSGNKGPVRRSCTALRPFHLLR